MASSQPNMEKFLRDWRQDALNKAQYDSAIFVGDKLLAMTSMRITTTTIIAPADVFCRRR
jgi:hypothetical protein